MLDDCRLELISTDVAREVYGVVIDESGAGVDDPEATRSESAPSGGGADVPVYREVNEMPQCASCGKLLPVDGIAAERLGNPVVFCSRAVHPHLRHLQAAEVRRRRGLAIPEIA